MSFPPSKLVRFSSRIRASIALDQAGCWLWTKSKARNGYGSFALGGGSSARAHRISYLVFRGPIPDGMDVCHRCDVRSCVNPDHLFLGTRSENLIDASKKGRLSRIHQKRGSQHPSAKLCEADVLLIRRRLDSGHSRMLIARDYGVSDVLIGLIARRKNWRHI